MTLIAALDIAIRGDTHNLDKSLDKAQKGVKDFSSTTAMIGGGIGALFGGFGAPIGAAIGGAVGKVGGALGGMFSSVKDGLGNAVDKVGEDMGGMFGKVSSGIDKLVKEGSDEAPGIAKSYASAWEQITSITSDAWERITSAAKPALDLIGSGFSALAAQIVRFLKPVFNWLVQGVEGFLFAANEVFIKIGEAIKPAWDWLVKLIDKWVASSENWTDGGEVAIKALKGIGIGLSYVYDAIRALAGAAAIVMGKIVDHLEKPFLNMLARMSEGLAAIFPDDFGGAFFKGISQKLDNLTKQAGVVGKEMQKWGKDAMKGFGTTAVKVGKFFDDVLEKFKNRKPKEKEAEDEKPGKAPKAVERGTDAAFEIIAKAQGDKMYKVANEQLQELKKMLDELKEIRRKKGAPGVQKAKL